MKLTAEANGNSYAIQQSNGQSMTMDGKRIYQDMTARLLSPVARYAFS